MYYNHNLCVSMRFACRGVLECPVVLCRWRVASNSVVGVSSRVVCRASLIGVWRVTRRRAPGPHHTLRVRACVTGVSLRPRCVVPCVSELVCPWFRRVVVRFCSAERRASLSRACAPPAPAFRELVAPYVLVRMPHPPPCALPAWFPACLQG